MALNDHVEMVLIRGGTFVGGFSMTDEWGEPLDSTWRGRLEVRAGTGDLVTSFASSGGDGTLTFTDFGQAILNLPSTYTANLEPTTDPLGLNTTHHVGDIEVWRAASPTIRYKPEAQFRVFVRPEVTTG